LHPHPGRAQGIPSLRLCGLLGSQCGNHLGAQLGLGGIAVSRQRVALGLCLRQRLRQSFNLILQSIFRRICGGLHLFIPAQSCQKLCVQVIFHRIRRRQERQRVLGLPALFFQRQRHRSQLSTCAGQPLAQGLSRRRIHQSRSFRGFQSRALRLGFHFQISHQSLQRLCPCRRQTRGFGARVNLAAGLRQGQLGGLFLGDFAGQTGFDIFDPGDQRGVSGLRLRQVRAHRVAFAGQADNPGLQVRLSRQQPRNLFLKAGDPRRLLRGLCA